MEWDGWVNQPFNVILIDGIEKDINFLLSETLLLDGVSFEQRYELLTKYYLYNEVSSALTEEDIIECGIVDGSDKKEAKSRLIDIKVAYRLAGEGTTLEGTEWMYTQRQIAEMTEYLYGDAIQYNLSVVQAISASGGAIRGDGASFATPGYESIPSDYKPFSYEGTKYDAMM